MKPRFVTTVKNKCIHMHMDYQRDQEGCKEGVQDFTVYEIWHFKKRFNKLFRGDIRAFKKIKLETSPWEKLQD